MYVQKNGGITNRDAREILGLAESTTKRVLKQMVQEGILFERGERKNRIYVQSISRQDKE